MAELKGSKTEKNLETAFAGESMARNKYTYFASKAKKDGYVQDKKKKNSCGSEKVGILIPIACNERNEALESN